MSSNLSTPTDIILTGQVHKSIQSTELVVFDRPIMVTSAQLINLDSDRVLLRAIDSTDNDVFFKTSDDLVNDTNEVIDYSELKKRKTTIDEINMINQYHKENNKLPDGFSLGDAIRLDDDVISYDVSDDFKIIFHMKVFKTITNTNKEIVTFNVDKYAIKFGLVYPIHNGQSIDEL